MIVQSTYFHAGYSVFVIRFSLRLKTSSISNTPTYIVQQNQLSLSRIPFWGNQVNDSM